MPDPSWLPDLIRMEDFGGDWNRYVEAVYAVFRRDFIETQPVFRGKAVLGGSQLVEGKHRTFWHLIQEGDVERDRIPDLRRCERVEWPRAIIEHTSDPVVSSWPNTRGRRRRQVLWLARLDYVVILEERGSAWWLWTAYVTDRPHTRRNLQREYEDWKKASAAP